MTKIIEPKFCLRLGIFIAGVAVLTGLAGCAPSVHQVEGTVMLISSKPNSVRGQWDTCSGQGGYSDIVPGAPVTIRDGSGEVVGALRTANLDSEILAELAANLRPVGMGAVPEKIIENVEKSNVVVSVGCILYFSGELRDAEFYTFEFSKRGEITYSRTQLNEMDWYVQFSLGR